MNKFFNRLFFKDIKPEIEPEINPPDGILPLTATEIVTIERYKKMLEFKKVKRMT